MENNKTNIIVSAIIFVVVIGLLVYITINKKPESANSQVGVSEQKKMDNTQQVDGVKITILKEGTGAVAKLGDTVAMKYTGKLTNGTVFDSNVDPKFGHTDPFIFTLGSGQVIKGWDVGVAGMKEGEKRMLELKPEYAYGDRAIGKVIPANSTLVFEVELLAIKK